MTATLISIPAGCVPIVAIGHADAGDYPAAPGAGLIDYRVRQ